MKRTLKDYRAWVQAKTKHDTLTGFEADERDLNPRMRADQKAITQWALQRGRAAEFIITGGGKALNALEWAHQVARRTDKPVIMFAPLAVADQFVDIEAPKWGYDLTYVRNQDEADAAKLAKDARDEKHICPLQLDLIERAIRLWTNPGDVVLDPFAGIGSVPYKAVEMGRYGVGIELKDSYFKWACRYIEDAERMAKVETLFTEAITAR